MRIYAYMHTYIPTYLPTYIHTYIHTYLHTYIHTYTKFLAMFFCQLLVVRCCALAGSLGGPACTKLSRYAAGLLESST